MRLYEDAQSSSPDRQIPGRIQGQVYVTEPIPGDPVENILDLIDAADLMIYGSTNTEIEFWAKVGWGHSTWDEEKLMQRATISNPSPLPRSR